MIKLFSSFIFFYLSFNSIAQDYIKRFEEIDVINYSITIDLNDSNNVIKVSETIQIEFLKSVSYFYLDLVDQGTDQKGMKISHLLENGKDVNFTHSNSIITISSLNCKAGLTNEYTIIYSGIPKDGLVIGKNKYGDRTFFGDNWPTRARNWIASVDHPSDKAFVYWHVEVPNQYEVIANGQRFGKSIIADNRLRFDFMDLEDLPTKVMVIGVAQFEVEKAGISHETPVYSWVYPQNKENGFYDYALAPSILDFFVLKFGDYPYKELANVQSTTRFGGMENASCIFYDENSINGKRDCETLLAHEIAHQWFGNACTEMDWPHLWLSEGFATYCTNLYIEEIKGKPAFEKQLEEDRSKVIRFSKLNKVPVIDTISQNLMSLLNANAYQKGSWILHMLRRKIGDDLFYKGIRSYYDTYRFSNATSDDFIKIMELTSGQDLSLFFDQWLRKSGHPKLSIKTKSTNKNISIKIKQVQNSGVIFNCPIEIKYIYSDDTFEIKTVEITQLNQSFSFPISKKIKSIIIDPNVNLLFEEVK